jgi:hypothetical protein
LRGRWCDRTKRRLLGLTTIRNMLKGGLSLVAAFRAQLGISPPITAFRARYYKLLL